MASSSSSSSDATPMANHPAPNFVSNCLLASSAFLPTRTVNSSSSSSSSNCKYLNPDDIQKSFVSAIDGFFRSLNSNPMFRTLSSWSSSHVLNFRQIHSRNHSSLNSLSMHNFAAILPGDSVAGIVVANGISNFLNLYNTVLVVRLVLTWFPNSPPAIVGPLSTICDPYLNIFRGLIPPLGGTLDLSPILAFLVLNGFTSTASALPAELPTAGASENISSRQSILVNLTTAQRKWMKRVCGSQSKNSGLKD